MRYAIWRLHVPLHRGRQRCWVKAMVDFRIIPSLSRSFPFLWGQFLIFFYSVILSTCYLWFENRRKWAKIPDHRKSSKKIEINQNFNDQPPQLHNTPESSTSDFSNTHLLLSGGLWGLGLWVLDLCQHPVTFTVVLYRLKAQLCCLKDWKFESFSSFIAFCSCLNESYM